MGHQDKKNYAEKHPGKSLDPIISGKISSLTDNTQLTCAAAHRAARDLNLKPLDIGIQADLMEFTITRCQLGLFGYSPQKKNIDPDIEVSKALDDALDQATQEGRISCAQGWEIADAMKIKRLDLGSACEKKGIRIKPCQLGAF